MRKYSLGSQASTLSAMRDRGAVDALKRHAKLTDAERDYYEGALSAAVATLRLFAEHEDAIRAYLADDLRKRGVIQ